MGWVVSLSPDEDDTVSILETETHIAFQTETGHPGRETGVSMSVT